MNEENRKYEEWLDEVRSKQPVLTHPEQLTTDIMQRISEMSKPKKRRYIFGSWITGIAAVILLCLFVSEAMKLPVSPENRQTETTWEAEAIFTLPSNWNVMTLSEKGSYVHTRRMKLIKQEELINKTIQMKLTK